MLNADGIITVRAETDDSTPGWALRLRPAVELLLKELHSTSDDQSNALQAEAFEIIRILGDQPLTVETLAIALATVRHL